MSAGSSPDPDSSTPAAPPFSAAYDVVVVGGGPAGLAAALTLGRACRRTLVLDSAEYRNAPARAVHNLLSHDGTPPGVLRATARAQLARYPSVEYRRAEVRAASAAAPPYGGGGDAGGAEAGPPPGFELRLTDGEAVRARRLVLATGLADELPPIPGVAEIWGTSAFHCPYCHGFEAVAAPVAVIGGTPDRVRLALQLRRMGADVTLCTDGPPGADLAPLDRHGVAVRCEPVTRLESRDGELEAVVFEAGPPLARGAAFVSTRTVQRSPLAASLGCRLLPDGVVEVDDFGRTSVPGVHAIGDMSRRPAVPMPFAAVSVASASGTIAASLLDQDLLSEDTGLPLPFARPPEPGGAGPAGPAGITEPVGAAVGRTGSAGAGAGRTGSAGAGAGRTGSGAGEKEDGR
ncbi:NAD(P)/FAD-dependent oxidoreductase [Bailinhaonella thermotolerans]|uniref:NAD(P)/FAD-dependent oxidoreductase n=2 Tax=Bailinhaonella thermotolerans TaxID=1070861 RepID=A0A3A3ZZC9_9ACTN|nr:NAD(P)/FAD-dependent oxidoreductase [Bailinhaonella thermotolerans]